MWAWMVAHEAEVRIATTLVFGLSSGLLAVVALWVAYRNNFGWKALVVVSRVSEGGSSTLKSEESLVLTSFEIWNRRKYPILVKFVEVGFSMRYPKKPQVEGEKYHWQVDGIGLLGEVGEVLEPQGRLEISAGALCRERETEEDNFPIVTVIADYFDPRKNKRYRVKGDSAS